MINRPAWQDAALCKGKLHLFYGDTPHDEAAALCDACPCRERCLADACDEERGIYGATIGFRAGMSARQRVRYVRLGEQPRPRKTAETTVEAKRCDVCGDELQPPGRKGGRPRKRCDDCRRKVSPPLAGGWHPLIDLIMQAEQETAA